MATRLLAGWHGVSIVGRGKNLSLFRNAETGFMAHPAYSSVGSGVLPPKSRRPKREVYQPSSCSAKVKNEWDYTATLPYAVIARKGAYLASVLNVILFVYKDYRSLHYA
jgi:hypothetical protein